MTLIQKLAFILILLCCWQGLTAKQSGRFIVGINSELPPFEFVDAGGKNQGSNIDILKALAKDTGYKFKYIGDDWKTIRTKFDKGEVQLVAGMIKTPQRQQQYLFTIPHTYIYYSIFIRSNSNAVRSWNALNNKQILMECGSVIEEVLSERGITARLLYASNSKEALERLSNGVGDAVIMPKIQGYYYISEYQLDNIIETKTLEDALPCCIALPIGYAEMQKNLDQSLTKLINSYQLRSSQNKWFGIYNSDESSLDKHTRFYRILFGAMIICLLIMAFLIYSHWKRIRQQKKYLTLQMVERNNYEREYNQRHQLFIAGPIIFLKWNDAKREMFESISDNFIKFGYDPNDVVSGKINYRHIVHPDDLEGLLLDRQRHIDNKEFSYYQLYRIICPPTSETEEDFEVVNVWHNRNYVLANYNTVLIRWIFDYTIVIPDEVTGTNQFYGYLLDITAEKRAETELLRQHQATQTDVNTKDVFLTSISAEINSPLNALIGLSHKIGSNDLTEEQISALEIIRTSALHLKQILQQIHDFLCILKGSMGSVPQWYVLKSLIEPIIAEYQIKIASKQLVFEYNEFQPTALVYLDADWFQKIIRIIMDNAVKFTGEGKIGLTIDLSKQKPGNDELVVKVIDTGVGIPEDKLQLILEPFTQVDETFTRRYGGIGLGLSIARNLMHHMGGKLYIVSNSGSGTAVELRFPIRTRN